jgi:CBS domain-containing protein
VYVQDLMTKNVVFCRPDDTLAFAAARMWEADCGVMPVLRHDNALVGMLTDRDICMASLFRGRSLDAIAVGEAMAKHVAFVHPGQNVDVAARLMADLKVRRIPVVDTEEQLLGIVSIGDIARESVRQNSRMDRGNVRPIDTLAAICQPRAARAR